MRVWITTVGWSPFAVINPLWAACCCEGEDHFIPEKVVILNNAAQNQLVERNLKLSIEWITRILGVCGIEDPIIESVEANEDDMNKFADTFKHTIKKQENDTIAIDMTPGRKFMSSIAMIAAKKYNVEKLYYLHLWGRQYQNQPFMKIPMVNQKLINLKKFLPETEV